MIEYKETVEVYLEGKKVGTILPSSSGMYFYYKPVSAPANFIPDAENVFTSIEAVKNSLEGDD